LSLEYPKSAHDLARVYNFPIEVASKGIVTMSPKIVTSRDQLPNQLSSIESILGIAIIPKIEREKRETLSAQGEK